MGFKILGTGSYVPERIVTNKEIESRGISNSAWVSENLGIHERRVAADDQATSDLALGASRAALEASGLSANAVDLLIVGTTTPDRKAPSTACILQDKLGGRSYPAFDISAACSSFLYSLASAAQFIETGFAQRALVVGADMYSTITDWEHRDAVFFGDAAGAVVIEAEQGHPPWEFFLGAEGAFWDHFTVPPEGADMSASDSAHSRSQFFKLMGPELYEDAVRTLPDAAMRVLRKNGLAIEDVDLVVPHQASIRVLEAVADRTGVPMAKMLTTMGKFGNTAAASQPLTLDLAVRSGKVRRGMTLLFLTFGAGITYGAALGTY